MIDPAPVDAIVNVRELLNRPRSSADFSPAARYAVSKLCDYAEQEHEQREKAEERCVKLQTQVADACRVTLAIFFTALLDKEGMDAEQLQRIWREVEALSESVRDGYVSAPDLIRVLRDEYEIDIIGG